MQTSRVPQPEDTTRDGLPNPERANGHDIFEPATVSLTDFYRDAVLPRLTAEQVYDDPSHAWNKSPDKWRGGCPWHDSKSGGSFNVSLDNLLWFCQGCGFGGSPLEYLGRRRGLVGPPRGGDFVDLLRELSERAGVPFPDRELTPEEQARAEQRAARRAALETVYQLSQDELWSERGEAAREYLLGRGLNDDALRDLELGLYPAHARIEQALRSAGYQATVNEGAWGKLDGYIIFPWRDERGHAQTLYGRWPGTEPPDKRPKTLALPGRESKSSPLYFDRARRAGCTAVVLVEGLLDAAVAQALGQVDVVAYVGGQPSFAQLATLKRNRIKAATICPDPDAGGDAGILSFLKNLDPTIRAYVAEKLPDNQDPDEYIRAHGIDAWRSLINRAVRGPVYRAGTILTKHDLTTPKGRDDALEELVEYADDLAQARDVDEVARLAAGSLQMPVPTLLASLSGEERQSLVPVVDSPQRNGVTPDGVEQARDAVALPDVIETFRRWLYLDDVGPIYATLAAVAANRMAGDPLWLMVVGAPSGGKTEVLNAISRLPDMYMAATLTEAALLSGTPKRDKDKGSKGGLLREIGDFGILVCKDFTSVLSMNRDPRGVLLAALREIFDGSWTRHVGVDGGRTLSWSGKLGLIAGCTTTIDSHHAVMATMGERFLLYRLPEIDPAEQAERALANTGREVQMRRELAESVAGLFAGLELPATPPPLSDGETRGLVALASLAARCRSAVERDGRTREIELIPDPEAPARIAQALRRLYGGLIVIGLDRLTAWSVVVKVGLDCMPKLRRSVFEFLSVHQGWSTTAAVATDPDVTYPTVTARRALEDLMVHAVVERKAKGKGGSESDDDDGDGRGKSDYWRLTDWARERYKATLSEKSVGASDHSQLGNGSINAQRMCGDFSDKVGDGRGAPAPMPSNGGQP